MEGEKQPVPRRKPGFSARSAFMNGGLGAVLDPGFRRGTGKVIAAFLLLFPVSSFAQQEPQPDWMQYKNPYAGEQTDITKAHRSNAEILAWSSKAVAEALSFPAGTFDARVKGLQPYFVKAGWISYADYLRRMNLLDVARGGKYAIVTAADGDPMLANDGAMSGAWHWEVSVPVIISITQADASGAARTVSSSKSRIDILASRVPADGVDGIAIESWTAADGQK
jgi:hypothetical protein